MIRTFAFAGAAALLVASAAPAFAQHRDGPPPGAASDEFRGERTQRFVTAAAQTDEYERRAGRIAQRMAVSNRVRDFGAMMLTDHTKTTEDLKAAIRRSGHTPPPPPPLRPDQQRMLDELRGAGRGFDFAYLRQQVKVHQEALGVFQDYAGNGHNDVIVGAARQTIPLIQRHLEMAQRLQDHVRR